jgi:hypothetical protein
MPDELVRCIVFERRIAREALLDALLGKDFEPWSFAPCSSTTEDAPEAADNEEVVDEEILHSIIKKLSLAFDSDELSDMLAASAAPPPPFRIFGRGAAMVMVDAMPGEDFEEVIDEEILQSIITKLSLAFDSDELSVLVAFAAPPQPLRIFGRGAAMAMVDAEPSKYFEPWSFAPCSSTTEDAPVAVDNEEVIDEEILQSSSSHESD